MLMRSALLTLIFNVNAASSKLFRVNYRFLLHPSAVVL